MRINESLYDTVLRMLDLFIILLVLAIGTSAIRADETYICLPEYTTYEDNTTHVFHEAEKLILGAFEFKTTGSYLIDKSGVDFYLVDLINGQPLYESRKDSKIMILINDTDSEGNIRQISLVSKGTKNKSGKNYYTRLSCIKKKKGN